MNVGAIAGGSVGGVVVLVLIIIGIFMGFRSGGDTTTDFQEDEGAYEDGEAADDDGGHGDSEKEIKNGTELDASADGGDGGVTQNAQGTPEGFDRGTILNEENVQKVEEHMAEKASEKVVTSLIKSLKKKKENKLEDQTSSLDDEEERGDSGKKKLNDKGKN